MEFRLKEDILQEASRYITCKLINQTTFYVHVTIKRCLVLECLMADMGIRY
jgi:hypothetical protein